MNELIHSTAAKQQLTMAISLMVLIFGRVSFAVFFTPFFGGRQIPARIKTGVGLALSILIYPALAKSLPTPLPLSATLLTLLFIKEAFVGLCMGTLVSMVFYGMQAAGQLIDNERGLAIAAIFNPQIGGQVSLSGQLFFELSVIIFLIAGGHMIYLQALFHSFEVLPLVSYPNMNPDLVLGPTLNILIKVGAGVLLVALQLAAPIMISMFLAEVVLGIANRVAPQMDVLFISYTLKAIIGLIVMVLGFSLIVWQMKRLFVFQLQSLHDLIQLLKP